MIAFDVNGANPITVSVPVFHKGAIKYLAAVSPTGFVRMSENDGCCFIFDVDHLALEIASAAETLCTPCLSVGHSRSSVGWRSDFTVAMTTDSGNCALLVVRGNLNSMKILGNTQYTGAASHTWLQHRCTGD